MIRTLALFSAAILLIACTTSSDERSTCAVESLKSVFSEPQVFIGHRFCGHVRAIRESRAVKLFPIENPLPTDRTDILLLPDRRTQDSLEMKIPQGRETRLYVEGTINADIDCFQNPDVACLPYRRPLLIQVSRFRVIDDK